jgi:hypothetical protein
MSEGGSIKVRLANVQKELEEEFKKWMDAGIPPVGAIYRLNDNEFMHHVHTLAHTKLLKEKLGLTDDEVELAMREVFLSELRLFFPIVLEKRREQLTAKIMPPGIIRPGNGGL